MKKYCQRCGFEVHKTQHIFSRYTGNYYCTDASECDRRASGDLTFEEISQLANKVREQLKPQRRTRKQTSDSFDFLLAA